MEAEAVALPTSPPPTSPRTSSPLMRKKTATLTRNRSKSLVIESQVRYDADESYYASRAEHYQDEDEDEDVDEGYDGSPLALRLSRKSMSPSPVKLDLTPPHPVCEEGKVDSENLVEKVVGGEEEEVKPLDDQLMIGADNPDFVEDYFVETIRKPTTTIEPQLCVTVTRAQRLRVEEIQRCASKFILTHTCHDDTIESTNNNNNNDKSRLLGRRNSCKNKTVSPLPSAPCCSVTLDEDRMVKLFSIDLGPPVEASVWKHLGAFRNDGKPLTLPMSRLPSFGFVHGGKFFSPMPGHCTTTKRLQQMDQWSKICDISKLVPPKALKVPGAPDYPAWMAGVW